MLALRLEDARETVVVCERLRICGMDGAEEAFGDVQGQEVMNWTS